MYSTVIDTLVLICLNIPLRIIMHKKQTNLNKQLH